MSTGFNVRIGCPNQVRNSRWSLLLTLFSSAVMCGSIISPFFCRTCVDSVGWDTALQAVGFRVRFPILSLGFFINIILPAVLWPCGWLSFWQKWVGRWCKGGRCVRLTTLPPSYADCLEILGASTFWSPKNLSRPVQGLLYLLQLLFVLFPLALFVSCDS